MAQTLSSKILGLYSYPNNFSAVPDGALSLAQNITIDRPSIAETRRGRMKYGDPLQINPVNGIRQLFEYQQTKLVNYTNTLAYDSDGMGTWVAYIGNYTQPSNGFRMRSVHANKNLYFSTNNGIQKLASVHSQPVPAGVPRALGGEISLDIGTGFLPTGSQVAYRMTWVYTDINGNLNEGYPSERLVIGNNEAGPVSFVTITDNGFNYTDGNYAAAALAGGTGSGATANISISGGFVIACTIVSGGSGYLIGDSLSASLPAGSGFAVSVTALNGVASNVDLTFYIPDGIDTTYTYRIYRTTTFQSVPDDNCYECLQGNVASMDITNKFFSVVDTVPDSLLGVALYTNPDQESIQQGNLQPPLANDMAYYYNYTFYANYTTKLDMDFSLLSAGGMEGLQLGDTLTIGGVVYTASAVENAIAGQFLLYTISTPAINIANTVQSLIRVINTCPSNSIVYAHDNSGDQTPGSVEIEARSVSTPQFYLNSSNPNVWNPVIPTTGNTVGPISTPQVNGMAFSKVEQPEAVPALNTLAIGSAEAPIYRILALKDRMFIMKQDGVYVMTGTDPSSWVITQFNATQYIQGPETAVVLNDSVYMVSQQGCVTLSSQGTGLVSNPIQRTFLTLIQSPNFAGTAFGVAYEAEDAYLVYTITNSGDTVATQAFKYNYLTQSWTTEVAYSNDNATILGRTCGLVMQADGKMYLGGVG